MKKIPLMTICCWLVAVMAVVSFKDYNAALISVALSNVCLVLEKRLVG